ncbi:MAG TPA: hypothetical protein VFE27_07270 [Acidobacteriaceae bacterium]|jgi:hypothetical protein|nr:hypothetical protein [Acidobacteriaceae bacterium]
MYVTWRDVEASANVVRVSHKTQYAWTPKAYKRSVPVPSDLIASLQVAKPANAKPQIR